VTLVWPPAVNAADDGEIEQLLLMGAPVHVRVTFPEKKELAVMTSL
jgi:hypothetical protein